MRHGLALMTFGAAVVLASALGIAQALLHADRAIVDSVHGLAVAETTTAVRVVTDLGGMAMVPWLCAVAALTLLWRGHWTGALAVTMSVLATQAVVAIVKGVVERPRPEDSDALVHAAGYAFPSGHAATAAALYGALVLIAHERLAGRTRAVVVGGALALALAIGLSRVYLGAHYPTDVLAGWLVGATIAAAACRLAGRLPRGAPARVAPA